MKLSIKTLRRDHPDWVWQFSLSSNRYIGRRRDEEVTIFTTCIQTGPLEEDWDVQWRVRVTGQANDVVLAEWSGGRSQDRRSTTQEVEE